jgi:hypothetical protein
VFLDKQTARSCCWTNKRLVRVVGQTNGSFVLLDKQTARSCCSNHNESNSTRCDYFGGFGPKLNRKFSIHVCVRPIQPAPSGRVTKTNTGFGSSLAKLSVDSNRKFRFRSGDVVCRVKSKFRLRSSEIGFVSSLAKRSADLNRDFDSRRAPHSVELNRNVA